MIENDGGPRRAQFWQDFAKTVTALGNTYLEISFAPKGGSQFNKAIYHETINGAELAQYAASPQNVSFLAFCHQSFLPVTPLTLGKRLGSNQCIRQKNLLIFDLDFKEQEADPQEIVKRLREKAVPVWLVNHSGNGLHVYLKLFTPMQVDQVRYKGFYHRILEELEAVTGVRFDPACSNPGRLMRLPLSTNWKNPSDPKRNRILLYQADADAGPYVQQFMSQAPVTSAFQGRKEVFAKLDLVKILNFFKYGKFDSLQDLGDKIIRSSPFSHDKTPSFHYEKSKKVFFDFSTARSGDLLNLIAFHTELDIRKDFQTIVQYARKIAGLVAEGNDAPSGRYELKDSGVWFLARDEESGEGYWVSSFLDVIAFVRDTSNEGWGRLLLIRDKEGHEKTWNMPMEFLAGDGLELRKKLLNLGVSLNLSHQGRIHLVQYLGERRLTRYLRTVEKLGWHEAIYVLPDRTFTAAEVEDTDYALAQPERYRIFQTGGQLSDWQREIGAYAVGNSLLILALAAAFAPPLLAHSGDENFGIHFVGPSSIGKTISLDVAGSVWGGSPSQTYKTRWRATVNGLEGLAVKHNDTLLTLDELAEVSPRGAGAAAYMLANGSGKVRGSREGRLLEPTEWRLIFLSAGEIDLATHLESDGRKSRAGQELRMISLAADAGQGLGTFEKIHPFATSAQFADHLRVQSLRYYGTPIRAFLERLVCLKDLARVIDTHKGHFLAQAPTDLHGQGQRLLKHFALLYAAGTLAIDFGILGFRLDDLLAALNKHFHAWLERNGRGSLETETILSQIRCYLQTYGSSRFPILDDWQKEQVVHQCAGFRKKNEDGDFDWLILGEVFRTDICLGFDYKTALSILKERALLLTETPSNLTKIIRTPSLGRVRVYHLKSNIISAEGMHAAVP